MKKLFLAFAAIIFLTAVVNAQETTASTSSKSGFGLSVLGEIGGGTFSGGKLALGGALQGEFNATPGFTILGSAGVKSFGYKYGTSTEHSTVIPILAGGKLNLGSSGVFAQAKGGYCVPTSGGSGSGAYEAALGYMLSKKFGVSLGYFGSGDLTELFATLILNLFH